MAQRFLQGYYKVNHPEKYMGDVTKVRFMSSWEYDAHKFFDNNKRVVRWCSEPFPIPYVKPTDGRVHNYFVDYYCEYIDVDGVVQKELIELKPLSQTQPPSRRGKYSMYNELTYAVNLAKWDAAKAYCDKNGFTFRIITERSVFR